MRKNAAQRLTELMQMDQEIWRTHAVFAGIDEAGRGPLAGPVVAACVVMPRAPLLDGVDDSKKVPEARREALEADIRRTALFAGVGLATVAEIHRLNIRVATHLAMRRAAEGAPCACFLIDGHETVGLGSDERAVIGGDGRCYAIAAASILAKVARDRMMRELDRAYPQYGFAAHKGYGTQAHIEAIRAHGPCPEHRALFVRKIVGGGL